MRFTGERVPELRERYIQSVLRQREKFDKAILHEKSANVVRRIGQDLDELENSLSEDEYDEYIRLRKAQLEQ